MSLSGDGRVVAVAADIYVAVFRNDGTDWFQIGQELGCESTIGVSQYVVALSFDAKTVVIGEPEHTSDVSGPLAGRVFVYRLLSSGEEWIQVGHDFVGDFSSHHFGAAVSISDNGNRIAIGAPGPFSNSTVKCSTYNNDKDTKRTTILHILQR